MQPRTKTGKTLLKAAKLIDTPGKWCQVQLKSGARHCALGAITGVVKRLPEFGKGLYKALDTLPAVQVLAAAVGTRQDWSPHNAVSDFNDAPDTTHGDVMTAFALAIVLAEDAAP